MLKHSKLRKTI